MIANDPVPDYDLAAIRCLLTAAFSPETLHSFLHDRPLFEPIILVFGPGHGLRDMVDRVIDYCATRLLFDVLPGQVQSVNARQVRRPGPYVRGKED